MPDSSEPEQLIAAVFHMSRSAAKKKPNPGVDKIVEAMRARSIAQRRAEHLSENEE